MDTEGKKKMGHKSVPMITDAFKKNSKYICNTDFFLLHHFLPTVHSDISRVYPQALSVYGWLHTHCCVCELTRVSRQQH